MIPLRLAATGHLSDNSVVARLLIEPLSDDISTFGRDYVLINESGGWCTFLNEDHKISVRTNSRDVNGDVVVLPPEKGGLNRIIRAKSEHNSLLITERCDQLCVMCSQPPKEQHHDMFGTFMLACLLAPRNSVIGITGGEPMLFKEQLFALVLQVQSQRPDISFHILTNGQHFRTEDLETLRHPAFRSVTWAIPIYSTIAKLHDRIVGKAGAFRRLIKSFETLSFTANLIEVRTVVLRSNYHNLPELANFVTLYLPFVSQWSIMQMERIGFGRMNWSDEFFDTSVEFGNIARALCIAKGRGGTPKLFNFPLCTVPDEYRSFAVSSISDWKRKYEGFCEKCAIRAECGGFFEWYDAKSGFRNVG